MQDFVSLEVFCTAIAFAHIISVEFKSGSCKKRVGGNFILRRCGKMIFLYFINQRGAFQIVARNISFHFVPFEMIGVNKRVVGEADNSLSTTFFIM